jgi:hypothetical protein
MAGMDKQILQRQKRCERCRNTTAHILVDTHNQETRYAKWLCKVCPVVLSNTITLQSWEEFADLEIVCPLSGKQVVPIPERLTYKKTRCHAVRCNDCGKDHYLADLVPTLDDWKTRREKAI